MDEFVARWLERIDPQLLLHSSGDAAPERFRAPLAFTLRTTLTTLLRNLNGAWRTEEVDPAIAALVRILSIQEHGAEALQDFASWLAPLLNRELSVTQQAEIDRRIEHVHQRVLQEHALCRERIRNLRNNERVRRNFLPARRGATLPQQ